MLSFHPDDAVTMTVDSAPFQFAGDVAVQGRLIDGAVVDLNVMTRRGRARSAVTRIENCMQFPENIADVAIVYCHSKRCKVTLEDEVIWVGAGEALIFSDKPIVSIEGRPDAYLISIMTLVGC